MTRPVRFRLLFAAAAAAAASPLLSQSLDATRMPHPPEAAGYGIADQFLSVVAAGEFVPSATAQADTSHNANDGSRWMASGLAGAAQLVASLNGRLPEGAVIDQMCVFGLDSLATAGQNLIVNFSRYSVDGATGNNEGSQSLATAQSSANPGDFSACAALNETVRSRWDVDGDGQPEVASYVVRVDFGTSRDVYSTLLRLRSITFRWRRQVTPSPVSATFADVPAGHPYFRFVEALVASGITAGCGGGNYCPDEPLTRGQMAVFLSVALGLHWPAF